MHSYQLVLLIIATLVCVNNDEQIPLVFHLEHGQL